MKPKFKFGFLGYLAVGLFFLIFFLPDSITERDTSSICIYAFIILFCALMVYLHFATFRDGRRSYQQKLDLIKQHRLFAEPDEMTVSADQKTAIALNAKARKIILVNKKNETLVCGPQDVVDFKLNVNTSTTSVTRGELNYFWKSIGMVYGKTWDEVSTTADRVTLQVRTNVLEIPVIDIVLLGESGYSTDSYTFMNAVEVGTEWENTLRVFIGQG